MNRNFTSILALILVSLVFEFLTGCSSSGSSNTAPPPPPPTIAITKLVEGLEKSMGHDISNLSWMTDETKAAAEKKLKAITNNVGYPKKWRDYSKVTVEPNDYLGNAERVSEAMYDQRIEKIGKATDKTEWGMTTPTVNAFYRPQNNSIN